MIKYRVICDKEHEFDGWFAGSDAFDTQAAAGEIACPYCESTSVRKALMAPAVSTSKRKTRNMMSATESAEQVHKLMKKMREHVESNFDYVGDQFADEARRIHYGEADAREIYGEATVDEARELIEEGVEVAPLPDAGKPKNKTN